jgi:nicotinamidase-related amidase
MNLGGMTVQRALVVIDVQNEYFTGNLPIAYPPRDASLANINAAIAAARAAGIPVIAVQHSSPETSPLFARGTHAWELHPELGAHDHLVEKAKASSFHGTNLNELLADIDTVAIAGYMTQNCDESTARDAFHLGYAVEFLADATGTVPLANAAGAMSAEDVHRGVLTVMQSNFAAVVTTADWIEAVEKGERFDRPSIWASTAVARESQV